MHLETLQSMLRQNRIDAVALGPGTHMAYVVNVTPHADERPCLLVVTPTGAGFLMPALNAEEMRHQTDLPFFTYADADGPERALAELIDSLELKKAERVQVDETMRADFAFLFVKALGEPKVEFASDSVGRLRVRKNRDEIADILRNAALADDAMEAAYATARAGATEREVAAAVDAVFAAAGGKTLFAIVGAAGNGAFPHHATSDRALAEGDAIVIDIGGRLGRFSSDITRMVHIGPPGAEYLKVHAIVEQAVRAAMDASRPGAAAKDVDAAARGVIAKAGYGEFFVHRTGHGLGLEGHEPPYLTSTSETILEEGMVFSIEPGIYLPDRFGLRLEEIVILEMEGPRVVSRLPRDVVVKGD